MIKNYVKVAFRNLYKHKMFSIINISGLAVDITCCLLIAVWVMDELSFDKFYKDSQDIYHVLTHGSIPNNPSTPAPLAQVLKEEVPEVIDVVRTAGLSGKLFRYENNSFYENNIVAADPSFFRIFSFPFISGDPNSALDNLNSIVITETISEKYFGEENPIGKILSMGQERKVTVTGVIENVRQNSTLQFDMVIPFEIRILEAREQELYINKLIISRAEILVTIKNILSG